LLKIRRTFAGGAKKWGTVHGPKGSNGAGRADMKMTAAVLYQQGLPAPYPQTRPYMIEDVEIDRHVDDEAPVEIRAAGLCHADLGQVQSFRRRTMPMIASHEGAGTVREVSKLLRSLAPGVRDCGGRPRYDNTFPCKDESR
jgi:NADPH:quinone reductase-like Zn-dependent oxidoreductase